MFLLLLSCDPSAAGASSQEVTAIRVDPADVELQARTGEPVSTTFTAVATYGDGHEGAIDLVSWTLSNASIGTISSRGVFSSVDTNGGDATVTATHLDVSGTASLALQYREDVVEDGLDETVVAAFAAVEGEEAEGITLEYPLDGTTVPRNLAGLWALWSGMEEGEVARIRFASPRTDLSVYTAATSWEIPTDLWETITATNSRGSVDVQVTVGDFDGSSVSNPRISAIVNVTVNRFDATGSLTYWSIVGEKIMRVAAGETEAVPFYPVVDDGTCYGCHSISESRQWMIVTHTGGDAQYVVLDISDPDNPLTLYQAAHDKRMGVRTISPDGNWMLGVRQGEFQLYDLPSNTYVSTPAMEDAKFTHPCWSPAGDEIVAVRVSGPGDFVDEFSFVYGEIVKIPWEGTTLGEPEVLVARQQGYNLYYPEFSPDGEWVVFNRSTGDSRSDPDAELFIVPAAGGTPIRLDMANGEGPIQNSWARWAPLPDDDVLWFGFSSKRPYPVENPTSSQIWVTSIDPAKAREGQDPSSTPYWLPGQDSSSDNHVPLWWSR